jgi:hypothetical protein
MRRSTQHLFWGIFLIALGIIFLMGNLSEVGMSRLWPVFPLVVGLSFWIAYFQDRTNFGILMPGSILVVISLLFFYCNFTSWSKMEALWPIFILAPAVGFLSMYFGGHRESGLLFPAGILTLISIIFLSISHGMSEYWPVLLIVAGVILILSQYAPGMMKNKEKE